VFLFLLLTRTAHEALAIDSGCIEAYNVMAIRVAKSSESALEFLAMAEAIGKEVWVLPPPSSRLNTAGHTALFTVSSTHIFLVSLIICLREMCLFTCWFVCVCVAQLVADGISSKLSLRAYRRTLHATATALRLAGKHDEAYAKLEQLLKLDGGSQ